MGKIFGTDGVRGVANLELTPELAYKVGRAGAYVLTKEFKHRPRIVIAKDTRISGDLLESALLSGMCSVGAIVNVCSVIPTPAVPFLIKNFELDAGVMISASHNPVIDNGIKFFNKFGYKLSDKIEAEIEAEILKMVEGNDTLPRPVENEVGYKKLMPTATDDYCEFLKSTLNGESLKGLKVVLDCANGATFRVGPRVFEELGASVHVISNRPNGININDNCGSTHMQNLQKAVLDLSAHVGFAFDGDGDRCLAVDENGEVVCGDEILSILTMDLIEKKELKNDTVVGTVMTNLGLTICAKDKGFNLEKTAVGDRYILEKMLEADYNLGGEQSGHIIMLDYNNTGDGVLTAIKISEILKRSGKQFSELNTYMEMLPQVLVNAIVPKQAIRDYETNDEIQNRIKELENKYDESGRVLIRPSGTEPLVRVMIEGVDKAEMQKDAKSLAKLIERTLGGDL